MTLTISSFSVSECLYISHLTFICVPVTQVFYKYRSFCYYLLLFFLYLSVMDWDIDTNVLISCQSELPPLRTDMTLPFYSVNH